MPKNESLKQPNSVILICIILFCVSVGLFSTWGYQWVSYLLGLLFSVEIESTFFDLFIGLIAMVGSVFLFMGSIHLWNMRFKALNLLIIGTIMFFVKNLLDIVNDVQKLRLLDVVTQYDITEAALNIGLDFLQIGFWIFLLVYLNKEALQKKLIR